MATPTKAPAKKPGRTLAKTAGLPAGLRQGMAFSSQVVVSLMADPELLVPEIVAMFEFEGGDPDATSESIAAEDFAAGSLAELLGGGDATAAKEFVNETFCLKSVTYNKADLVKFPNALPFYAVLHGVTADGEVVHVTVGSENVVRKAALADSKGWLRDGGAWVVIRSSETKRGRTVLNLESAPADRVPFN